MKVLFIDAYFYPEKIAFTHLEKDILSVLVEAGNEVEVICPVPTRGISKEDAEKYKKIRFEKILGANVTRFWAPNETKNTFARAIRYLWCNIRTYQIAKKVDNVDVVFAVSTPPTQGFLAAKTAKKLDCKFVYSLQDIFPDSMVSAKIAKEGGLLWKIGRWIENYTYKNADKIIVISEGFKKNIMEKGVLQEKIEVIPNWIDTNIVVAIPKKDNKLYEELELDRNKFTVVYAGNFGASQGADIVIKSAEKLIDQQNIQFVIFGGGSEYRNIKEYVNSKAIKNIKLFDLLPIERVSEVYSLGDLAIVTGKKGVGKSGMPSKTWSIMACNTPILASFDTGSELSNVLKQAGAGICVEPEDAELLADAIMRICNKEILFLPSSRNYVCKTSSKNRCLEMYNDILDSVCQIKN